MMYFATPSTPAVREAMEANVGLGAMVTPTQGNLIPPDVPVIVDNECFAQPQKFGHGGRFIRCLRRFDATAGQVIMATAPDMVGDWEATIERSTPWIERIRALGFPPAIVLQDGANVGTVPWDAIDAVFVGGTTEWKLGDDAAGLIAEANRRGKWTHMGRVNSFKRLRLAAERGCDSADGTYIAFGPDINLPKVLTWLSKVNNQTRMDAAPVSPQPKDPQ